MEKDNNKNRGIPTDKIYDGRLQWSGATTRNRHCFGNSSGDVGAGYFVSGESHSAFPASSVEGSSLLGKGDGQVTTKGPGGAGRYRGRNKDREEGETCTKLKGKAPAMSVERSENNVQREQEEEIVRLQQQVKDLQEKSEVPVKEVTNKRGSDGQTKKGARQR